MGIRYTSRQVCRRWQAFFYVFASFYLPAIAWAQSVPGQVEVDVDTNSDTEWYSQTGIWIIGIIVFAIIIFAITRGGRRRKV